MGEQDQPNVPQGPLRAGATVALQPPRMKVGYNYPWIANLYGNHMGPNRWKDPPTSQVDPYWVEAGNSLQNNLSALAALGITVVRIFILCHGDNFRNNLTSYAKHIPDSTWDLPASLDPLFVQHFSKMVQAFQASGLQMIPSFVDFGFPIWEGRDVVFTDPGKRTAFLNMALDPLLAVGNQQTIFAWELMNEPSWCTRWISKPAGHYAPWGLISKSNLQAFLTEGLAKIKAAGFTSTVGHRAIEDFTDFPTGDLPQFHYYWQRIARLPIGPFNFDIDSPDPNPIPGYASTKAFIGEFDSSPRGHGQLWPECDGADSSTADATFERLKLLARKGYQLALIWPDMAGVPADTLCLSTDAQNSLKRFTKGFFINGVP